MLHGRTATDFPEWRRGASRPPATRIVLALIVGAALSTSGPSFQRHIPQSLWPNPYLLGSLCGAASERIAIVWKPLTQLNITLPLFAFIGLPGCLLVYRLATFDGYTGIHAAFGCRRRVGLYRRRNVSHGDGYRRDLRTMVVWLMGGLLTATWTRSTSVCRW